MGRILLSFDRVPREYLVCILLLTAILTIVIAPELDLLPTVVRVSKASLNCIGQVIILGIVSLIYWLFPALVRCALHADSELVQALPCGALMNCVLRC